MAAITTRAAKGSALTNAEVDANFTNINTELVAKLPLVSGTLTGNLTVNTGADSRLNLQSSGTTQSILQANATHVRLASVNALPLTLATAGTDRITINSTGTVMLGHTAARTFNGVVSAFQIEGQTAGFSSALFHRNSADNNGGLIFFSKTRGVASGANTLVADGDTLGSVFFGGADGAAPVMAALIKAEVDGTPGSFDMPGRLVFATTPDGSSALAERMRITNLGSVGIGTTTPGNRLTVQNANDTYIQVSATGLDTTAGVVISNDARSWALRNSGPNSDALQIRDATAGAQRLTITAAGQVLLGVEAALQSNSAVVPLLQTAGVIPHQLMEIVGAHSVGPTIYFQKNRGAAAGTYTTAVVANDGLMYLAGAGSNGVSNTNRGTYIASWAAETFTDTTGAAYMTFGTTPTGTITPVERMRIDARGHVGIGQPAATTVRLHVADTGNTLLRVSSNTSGDALLQLFAEGVNGGAVSYLRATQHLALSNGGVDRVFLNTAGDLLVGQTTNANSSKMVVNGTIETTSGIRFPTGGVVAAAQGMGASIQASEALAAGDLVNVHDVGGAFRVRRASAASAGMEAHGYIVAAVGLGSMATVFFDGLNTGISGLAPGNRYLSTSPGLTTLTAPSATGQVVQRVGFCVSASSLRFTPGDPITLA